MSETGDKVIQIFRELAGERADKLNGSHFPADINSRIAAALTGGSENPTDETILRHDQVDFHLVDWQSEAAFLVALVLSLSASPTGKSAKAWMDFSGTSRLMFWKPRDWVAIQPKTSSRNRMPPTATLHRSPWKSTPCQ